MFLEHVHDAFLLRRRLSLLCFLRHIRLWSGEIWKCMGVEGEGGRYSTALKAMSYITLSSRKEGGKKGLGNDLVEKTTDGGGCIICRLGLACIWCLAVQVIYQASSIFFPPSLSRLVSHYAMHHRSASKGERLRACWIIQSTLISFPRYPWCLGAWSLSGKIACFCHTDARADSGASFREIIGSEERGKPGHVGHGTIPFPSLIQWLRLWVIHGLFVRPSLPLTGLKPPAPWWRSYSPPSRMYLLNEILFQAKSIPLITIGEIVLIAIRGQRVPYLGWNSLACNEGFIVVVSIAIKGSECIAGQRERGGNERYCPCCWRSTWQPRLWGDFLPHPDSSPVSSGLSSALKVESRKEVVEALKTRGRGEDGFCRVIHH